MEGYSDPNDEKTKPRKLLDALRNAYAARSDYRDSLGSLMEKRSTSTSWVLYSSGYSDDNDNSSVSSSSVQDYHSIKVKVDEILHSSKNSEKFEQRCEINYEEITIKEKLGEGAFGGVYKGELWGMNVAVKFSHNPDKDALDEFMNEVEVLKSLRHPNVILFLGFTPNSEKTPFAIVTEYMDQGSLHDILHNQKVRITNEQIFTVALGVAHGLHYLHSQHPAIVHKDIKSGNVLVANNWQKIALSDFGLSILLEEAENIRAKYVGTVPWRAPEATAKHYTPKADIYSFGMLLWELITRDIPFKGQNFTETIASVRSSQRPPIPAYCPQSIKQLIEACWHQEPSKRPTASQIIETINGLLFKFNTNTQLNFENLKMNRESMHISLPSWVKYCRVAVGMLKKTVSFADAFEFSKKYVIGIVNDLLSGIVFLYQPKTGQFYCFFVYSSLEAVKAADERAMEYEKQIGFMNEMCCAPVYREMRESQTYGNPSGKYVVFVKSSFRMGSEELTSIEKKLANEIMPYGEREANVRGIMLITEHSTGRVWVLVFLDDEEAVKNFYDKGLIQDITSQFSNSIHYVTSVEEFQVIHCRM